MYLIIQGGAEGVSQYITLYQEGWNDLIKKIIIIN